MKCNLKNRPKTHGTFDTQILRNRALEMEEWFEGFEKELRKKLNRIQSNGTSDMLLENLIEEILGE